MARIKAKNVVKKRDIERDLSPAAIEACKPGVTNTQNLTVAKIKKFLPKGTSVRLTEEIVEKLTHVEQETGIDQGLFEEQLLSYLHLMEAGAGIEKLANAIKFCNLRMLPKMGNEKAWMIVFPEKTKEILERGEDCSSFASMYNSTKMVREISKLLLVPVYISHAPVHIAMHKKLYDLSNGIGANKRDYVSPTVQMNASIALMEATRMPEDNSIELKIGMSDDAKSVQLGLTEQLARMAEIQLQRLEKGENIADVQRLNIISDPTTIEAEIDRDE